MNTDTRVPFREGDWVKGTSFDDERFRGFALSMRDADGLVRVQVTQSDNDSAVGRIIEAPIQRVELIPNNDRLDEGMWQSLIDLALSSHDSEWFSALMAKKPPSSLTIRESPNDTIFTTQHRTRW